MRLFIAINFNDKTRVRLLALRDGLRSKSERGNFSAPENIHLTLAFLGECDIKQTAAAKSAINAVSFEPFDITVDCIGRFKRDGGDIWWTGLRESKPLIALQGELTDKLIAAGFTLETRKFSPHITLGREVATDAKPWKIEPFGETVGMIDLMKSERVGGKLTYTSIYTKKQKIRSKITAMKYVLLSADNSPSVYSVPDIVADNLREYCCEFCDKWLYESPHAEEYRTLFGVAYNEADFIKYLNKWVFPDNPSVYVETLDWSVIGDAINGRGKLHLPEKYKDCKWFNF